MRKTKIKDPAIEAHRVHDLEVEDLTESDIDLIRSNATREFVDRRVQSNVELIARAYHAFLHSRGFKIVNYVEQKKTVKDGARKILKWLVDKGDVQTVGATQIQLVQYIESLTIKADDEPWI